MRQIKVHYSEGGEPVGDLEALAYQVRLLGGLANIRAINKAFRLADESHKWPISGKFNVTERAIRNVRRSGRVTGGLPYCETLDREISNIVNDPKNW